MKTMIPAKSDLIKRPWSLSRFALGFVAVLALSGCGKGSGPGPGEACGLPQEQWDSFMAPADWQRDQPIRVTVDRDFVAEPAEYGAIEAAVNAWNGFSVYTLGGAFFEADTGEVDSRAGPAHEDSKSCDGFVGGGDDQFSIVRVTSSARWKDLGLEENVPAITARCYAGGSLKRQAILINTRIADRAQFKAIVMHELGHSLGLGHSCTEERGNPNYVSCKGLSTENPLYEAVMFPVFKVGEAAILREDLRRNDMERANCLYRNL